MPDWRLPVFVEGPVDRAVLEGLRAAGLLSAALHFPDRSASLTGKDQVLRELASAIDARLRAVALIGREMVAISPSGAETTVASGGTPLAMGAGGTLYWVSTPDRQLGPASLVAVGP